MKTTFKEVLKSEARIVKGKVLKLWGKLIQDESVFLHGSYEEFYGKIQLRNGNFFC